MAEQTPVDQDIARAESDTRLVLDLDGYEGPIDVLLTLAREQKVDLKRISILELADQYLAFIARAGQLRLEIAADYLVMAAWLAYLKSRLLLPQSGEEGEPSATDMAAALSFQLQRLEAMREAGVRLMARPQLGREVFARGSPEKTPLTTTPVFQVSLYDLLKAYALQRGRIEARTLYIEQSQLYSADDALKWLSEMLGGMPDWQTLRSFLPPGLEGDLVARSALASTLAASLELTRAGKAQLRQDVAFGPIYLRRKPKGK